MACLRMRGLHATYGITGHAKIRRHPYDKASMMTRVLESAGRDLFIDTTSKDLSNLETVSPSVVSGVL